VVITILDMEMRENGSIILEGRKERREQKPNLPFPSLISVIRADVTFKFFSQF